MIKLGSFFKKGAAEATAAELWQALQAAEAERQTLREREQALSVSRQDVLLEDNDDELDTIEAELTTIARAAERHDLRIPELRRLHGERRDQERAATNKRECDAAVAERLKISEQIDSKLQEIGILFADLERTAVSLRRLDDYHMASRRAAGQMMQLVPEKEAVRMAILDRAPEFARVLKIEAYGSLKPVPYRQYEDALWARLLRGVHPPQPRQPEMHIPSDEERDAAEAEHALARRYSGITEVRLG